MFKTFSDVQLTEYVLNEGEVLKKLNQVSVARREVEIVSH